MQDRNIVSQNPFRKLVDLWRRVVCVTLVITACAAVSRASTVTTATCTVTVGTTSDTKMGASSCSDSLPAGLISYTASASITGSQTTTSSSFSGDVSAYAGVIGFPAGYASATAQATGDLLLYTAGPARPGVLTIEVLLTPPNGIGVGQSFSTSFNLGGISSTCTGQGMASSCTGLNQKSGLPIFTLTTPFTLGQTFDLQQSFLLSALDGPPSDGPNTSASITLLYSLTDAGGNAVPVLVASPEPAAPILMGTGGFFLMAMVYWQKRHNA